MKIMNLLNNIYICLRHPVQFWAAIRIIPHIIRTFNDPEFLIELMPPNREDMD